MKKSLKIFALAFICLAMVTSVLPSKIMATEPSLGETANEIVSPIVSNEEELEKALADKTISEITLKNKIELTTIEEVEIPGEKDPRKNAGILIDRSVTINGNGYSIVSSNVPTAFEIYNKGETEIKVTFKDITIESSKSDGRAIDTRNDKINLTLDSVKLNMKSTGNNQAVTVGGSEKKGVTVNMVNSSATSAGVSGYGVIAFVPCDINIVESSIEAYGPIYMKSGTKGSTVDISLSSLWGENKHSALQANGKPTGNDFGVFVFEDVGTTVNVEDTIVKASVTKDSKQYIVLDKTTVSEEGNIVNIKSSDITSTENFMKSYNENTKVLVKNYCISNIEIAKDYLPAEAKCVKKSENMYRIYEKCNITVKEVEGGEVKVNPTSAYEGDTIALTYTTNKGYRLERIDIDGERNGDDIAGEELLEENITFSMPSGNVTVTPIFTKLTTEAEVSKEDVVNPEEVKEMVVESLKEAVTKDPTLAKKIEGKNIEVEVDPKPIEVNKEEKETIEKGAVKEVEDIKVAQYIDISVIVKDADTGEEITKLSTVKKAIKFTVEVPKELKTGVAAGYTRIFYIIRNHNGVIDVWETKEVDGKLSFESDKFSTYAIAYKDVKDETTVTPPAGNEGTTGEGGTGVVDPGDKPTVDTEKPSTPDVPQTGDNVVVYAVFAVVAMAGMAVTIKMKRK